MDKEEIDLSIWNHQYFYDLEKEDYFNEYVKNDFKKILNGLYGPIDSEHTYPHWVQIGGKWYVYDRKPSHRICLHSNAIVVKIEGKFYWAKHRYKALGQTLDNELSSDDMREMTFVILSAERGKV